MSGKNKKVNSRVLIVFDTLFIMILCFATLLSAMILKGGVISEMKYSVNWFTLAITLVGLGIYLCFVLPQSNKELKLMIKEIYGDKGR